MTATAEASETLTLDAIAKRYGITITDYNEDYVDVNRDGNPIYWTRRDATPELTLAKAVAVLVDPERDPQEWAVVMSVLHPGTTAE
jgi:hypothetical protein